MHRHHFCTISNIPGIGFSWFQEESEIRVLVRLRICLPLLRQVVPRDDLGSWLSHFRCRVYLAELEGIMDKRNSAVS